MIQDGSSDLLLHSLYYFTIIPHMYSVDIINTHIVLPDKMKHDFTTKDLGIVGA